MKTQKNYYTALDGIRGIGILLVLLAHFRLFWLRELTPVHTWEKWFLQIMDFNWITMEWFFAMSGFLITGILLKSKSEKGFFRNFYVRRFLRIFPLYYGFLAIYFFAMPMFMDMANMPESAYSFVAENQAWYWTYFANVLLALQGDWLGEMSHFWSLSVEEHFYMVWPFLVYFLGTRSLMIVSAIGIALSVALRAYFVWNIEMSPVSVYVLTFTRLDSLLMGSMLAVLAAKSKDFSSLVAIRKPLTILSAIFLPLMVVFYAVEGHFSASPAELVTQQQGHLYPLVQVWGYLMMAFVSCALVVWLLTGAEKNLLRRVFDQKFFRMLGQYSYGMYVIHFAVFGMFHQSPLSIAHLSEAFGSRALGGFVAFTLPFLATFWGAWAIWHGFEKHFIKLKKYFEYDSRKEIPVQAAPALARGVVGVAVVATLMSASSARADGWNLRGSMNAYTAGEGTLVADKDSNLANPGNRLLERPRYRLVQDFRPVVKLESDVGFLAVVKPRLQLVAPQIYRRGEALDYRQKVEFDLNEAYASAQLNESLGLTAGLQNFQWGPAELFSPSNQVFRFFAEENTPLFYRRGRNLFRMNWAPKQDLSLVVLAEIDKNKDADFQFQREFARKAAAKGEKEWAIGETNTLQLAGVIGTSEDEDHWIGQYAQVTLGESWAVYTDASENFRAKGYYPNPGVVTQMASRSEGVNGFFPRVLSGTKYTFSGGDEIRLEYLYNGLGWTKDQYRQAYDSMAAPIPDLAALNTARFLAPGLEFRGRHYAYTSLRVGDLGHDDQVTYFLRYLHNLTDQSGSVIASIEWTPADRWALIGAVMAQRGAENTEMTQIEKGRAQVALRVDF